MEKTLRSEVLGGICSELDIGMSEVNGTPWEPELHSKFQIRLHELIKGSGVPNFVGCRIPVVTCFNVSVLRLQDYWNHVICDFIEFGFPASHDGSPLPESVPGNHRGALDYPDQV